MALREADRCPGLLRALDAAMEDRAAAVEREQIKSAEFSS
jgi:hypothetical protein